MVVTEDDLDRMAREWDADFADLFATPTPRETFLTDLWYVTKGAAKAMVAIGLFFLLGMAIYHIGYATSFYAGLCLLVAWALYVLVKHELAPWDDV